MPNATKHSFYTYLSEVAWRTIAHAYGRAPDRVSFSEIWRETDSPIFNSNVFADLMRNNLITGNQEAFTITAKGKTLYEGAYIYYRHLHPSVPLTKPPFFKQVAAASFYGVYRLHLYATAIREALSNWSQRRQRTFKYTQAQAALAQIATWPSSLDDGLHHVAIVIQEHLEINVVAIFIADPMAEWSEFRTGVVREPNGEEAIRILKERGHKTTLSSTIRLIDFLGHTRYQSDVVSSRSQLLSIQRLSMESTFRFGSPIFGYTGSVMLIPLWIDQKLIGTLELDTFNTQASFRQDELSTLLPLADQVAQICELYLTASQA